MWLLVGCCWSCGEGCGHLLIVGLGVVVGRVFSEQAPFGGAVSGHPHHPRHLHRRWHRHPRDTALSTLIGELSIASPEFRSWWADHDVVARCRGSKRFHDPVVGELAVYIEALKLQDDERWLYAYAAEPGTRSAEALGLLGSWAATLDAESTTDDRRAPDRTSERA